MLDERAYESLLKPERQQGLQERERCSLNFNQPAPWQIKPSVFLIADR